MASTRRAPQHYVNNREFSQAVVDYVNQVEEAESAGETKPQVTPYIAECFMKIAEGLSHKPNFNQYTFRDEMVMDAVENCLKAITNYNIEAATRTGNPNAFSYFTQISYYAFLRRIAKENRQSDIRDKFIHDGGLEDFIGSTGNSVIDSTNQAYVDSIRNRIDEFNDQQSFMKNAHPEDDLFRDHGPMSRGSKTKEENDGEE